MKTGFRIAILLLIAALPCMANPPANYAPSAHSAPSLSQSAPAAASVHADPPAPVERPGHFNAYAPLQFAALNIPQGPPADLLNEPHDPYFLGPGDKLELELMEVPDTRQISIVMPDGDLYYQTAHVHAAGLTITQLKAALEKELNNDYRAPQLSMILREPLAQSSMYMKLRVWVPSPQISISCLPEDSASSTFRQIAAGAFSRPPVQVPNGP